MPAAYTDIDEANARIDALEHELGQAAEAARQAHKANEKLRAELMEVRMTLQADPSMYRPSPERGTYAAPAGGQ